MLYFWFILIIILSIIEIATTNLVTIWFIASGLVSLVLSIFIDDLTIQFAVFVILGIILLLSTRKILNKYFQKDEKTNLDRVIGMKGIVTDKITKDIIGEVKVDGKLWSAISDEYLKVGDEVLIASISGVKLIVEKVSE